MFIRSEEVFLETVIARSDVITDRKGGNNEQWEVHITQNPFKLYILYSSQDHVILLRSITRVEIG